MKKTSRVNAVTSLSRAIADQYRRIGVNSCLAVVAGVTQGVLSPVAVAESGFYLEEVLVTAEKRPESLQETPISMQAYSADDLSKRAVGNISEVGDFTPNVEFDFTAPISGSSNAAVIFMRGIGQTDFSLTAESGVGIYLDGIYIARSVGGVLDLMDVEQVQILRGPQGTLFGKNTVGGAISVTTIKPSNETEGSVELTVGSDSRLDGKLSFNVPVIEDKLLLRVGMASKNQDGYGDRLQTGETMGDVNSDTVRAALLWLPTDDMDVTFAFDKTRAREDLPVSSLLKADPNAFFPVGNLGGLYNMYVANGWVDGPAWGSQWIDSDETNSNGTSEVGSKLDVWGASLLVNWDFDSYSVTSITGQRESESTFGRDQDHSPAVVVHTTNDVELEQFSQEFNIGGSAFDDRLDWLVGIYYFDEEGKDITGVPIIPQVFFADVAYANGPGMGLGYRGIGPIPLSVGGFLEIENNSKAIFTHNSFAFDDQWSMTFGIRYTEEEKKSNVAYTSGDVGAPLITNPHSTQTFYDVSPRLGVEYLTLDDVFLYASVSEGFKSGGLVSRYNAPAPQGIEFEPETVESYEVGFKSDFLDSRIRLNGAVFFTDYTDVQITVFNGIVPETRNAAEGEIKGAELEFTALLSPELMITGGLGYLDAAYTNLDTSSGGSLEVTEGHQFVNTPEWSGSVAVEYTMPVGELGDLMWRVDYSYRSEVAKDAANTPELMQDGFGLVNAMISLTPNSDQWQVSVFGRNLGDEEYLASGMSTTAFGLVEGVYGRTREFGAMLKYNF